MVPKGTCADIVQHKGNDSNGPSPTVLVASQCMHPRNGELCTKYVSNCVTYRLSVANIGQVGVSAEEVSEHSVAPGGVVAALSVCTDPGARLWEGQPWGFIPPPHTPNCNIYNSWPRLVPMI